jgi:hypothetical protein
MVQSNGGMVPLLFFNLYFFTAIVIAQFASTISD